MKKFRVIVIVSLITTSIFADTIPSESGICGDSLTWVLNNSELTISGYGSMFNYDSTSYPWQPYIQQITEVYDYRQQINCNWIKAPNIEYYHITCMADTACWNPNTYRDIFDPFEPDFSFIRYDKNVGIVELVKSPSSCDDKFVLMAYPNDSSRYAFDYWLDHGWSWENPHDTNVIQLSQDEYKQRNNWDTMYVAFKKINTYQLIASCKSERGYVTQGNGYSTYKDTAYSEGTYWMGDTAKLTVVPRGDYFFKCWSDGCMDNPRYITITGNASYTVEFIEKCGDNLFWEIKDSILYVTGYGDMWDLSTSSYGGVHHPLWNEEKNKIKQIIFSDSITSIGRYAFKGCNNLSNVSIPNSVTRIGYSAFGGCKKLTTINLPESVTSLEACAFSNSGITHPVYNSKIFAYLPTSLQGDYTIPDGIETLVYGWMYDVEAYHNLTSLTIPISVSSTVYSDTTQCLQADVYDYRSNIDCDYLRTCDDHTYYVMTPQRINYNCGQYRRPNNINAQFDCSYESIQDTTMCWGDTTCYWRGQRSYRLYNYETWNNRQSIYYDDVTDTLVDRNTSIMGCDSVCMLVVHYKGVVVYEHHDTIQQGETHWTGYSSSGLHYYHIYDIQGCDSNIYMIHLYVQPKQIQYYTITAAVNESNYGSVEGAGIYMKDTIISVTAVPNSGYKFVKWNDGKKCNPYTFTVLDDKYLMAIFIEETEEQDTTTVQPTDTAATFQWPLIDGGYTYTLTIYSDATCTTIICTLTFNQYGQLIETTFGASRRGGLSSQEESFTCTVQGLSPDQSYFYKMLTTDVNGKLLNTDEGIFTTQKNSGPATKLDKQFTDPAFRIQNSKFIRAHSLLILRDGNTYNAQGTRL